MHKVVVPAILSSPCTKSLWLRKQVRFNARKLLAGNWEPYPIDMSFEPPCMVLSTIGLAQPGKIERGMRAERCKNHLHQLHVCLPVRSCSIPVLHSAEQSLLPRLTPYPTERALCRGHSAALQAGIE